MSSCSMRRGAARLLIGGFLAVLWGGSCSAWGPEGHRIVARIAQKHLAPKSQRRVSLLFKGGVTLADVANWADEVRSERPETGPWHYINIPPSATELSPKRDCPNQDCVTAKIREFVGLVRLGLRKEQQRQEAFKFLVHLMGDLHQPLHAGYEQDRGGNKVEVLVSGEETNLHAFWDSAVVGRICDDEVVCAERLNQSITPELKRRWQKGYLRDWTWESHLQAVRVVYGALPEGDPKKLDDDYVRRATALAEEQLAKAGIRLAHVINDFWDH